MKLNSVRSRSAGGWIVVVGLAEDTFREVGGLVRGARERSVVDSTSVSTRAFLSAGMGAETLLFENLEAPV
jgi:hypothetical protein